MMLPKTISGWCMWLFFLFVGLLWIFPSFFVTLGFWQMLAGIFALVYAIAALFGK
jgi:hypothetical protein